MQDLINILRRSSLIKSHPSAAKYATQNAHIRYITVEHTRLVFVFIVHALQTLSDDMCCESERMKARQTGKETKETRRKR